MSIRLLRNTLIIFIAGLTGVLAPKQPATASGAPPSSNLTLNSPNGGEWWFAGEIYVIQWSAASSISNVKLELSSDGGASWNLIVASTPNDEFYNWTVPNEVSNTNLLRLSDASNAALNDVSDETFFILLKALVEASPSPSNPVLSAGPPGSWDERITERGWFMYENSMYHAWYGGWQGNYDHNVSNFVKLGYATSSDGVNWTKYSSQPIYNKHWTEDIVIVKDGSTYYMFAESEYTGDGDGATIDLYTSTDKVNWTRYGKVLTPNGGGWESSQVGTATVWKEGGTWYMLYEGFGNAAGQVGLATSSDAKNWSRHSSNPVLTNARGDQFDIALDSIIKRNDVYYAYGHYDTGGSSWESGMFTSIDLVNWLAYPGNPLLFDPAVIVDNGGEYFFYGLKSNPDALAPYYLHTSTTTITPPDDTTPPVFSQIAAGSVTSLSAKITWQTDEAADTQVEYGFTTSYGSASAVDQNFVNTHTVTLTGLAASKTYHYRVKSKDEAGNLAVSKDYTFTTLPPDVTPSVISNVLATNITGKSAQITWNTNEPSDSQLEYGLTSSYGLSSTIDAQMVIAHSLTLFSLRADTIYHYRVKSKDSSGNSSVSSDFTFTTTAPFITLFADSFNTNVISANKWNRGANAGNQSAVVNQQLELRAIGAESGWVITKNAYAARHTMAQVTVIKPNDDGALGISPTYNLASKSGIADQKNWYRFYVYRNGAIGPYRLNAQWKKNGVEGGLDVTGNFSITGKVFLRLRFDQTNIHFEASLDGVAWTDTYTEAFSLPGYALDAKFYYEFSAYNTAFRGVLTVDDFIIEAPAPDKKPPIISLTTAQNITRNGAQIQWQTNEVADSQAEYGLTTAYSSSSPLDTLRITAHTITLSGLQAGKTYHCRVKSKDAAGNLAVSNDFVFTTLPPPLTISKVAATNLTSASAKITWTTNLISDSQAEYGSTNIYGTLSLLDTLRVTAHAVTLSGLRANTLYHYRVKSKEAASKTVISRDTTFTTLVDRQPPVVSNLAVTNITATTATLTWMTDKKSSSQAEFGVNSTYGRFTPLDTALVTQHQATLANLAPFQMIQARVRSTDANGNTAVSRQIIFKTLPALDRFMLVSGDAQNGKPEKMLAAPLIVKALNTAGIVMSGVKISFRVTSGGGKIINASVCNNTECVINTGADGTAAAPWQMGKIDSQKVEAHVVERPDLVVRFTAKLDRTGIDDENANALPTTLALRQHPNPFRNMTQFELALPQAGYISLKIFDLHGREVVTLAEGLKTAGRFFVHWEGKDQAHREIASGSYFAVLRYAAAHSAGTFVEKSHLLYLK